MKEIEQRLADEQQEKETLERRQTRSQTDKPGTSAATDTGTEPVQRASQRKRKQTTPTTRRDVKLRREANDQNRNLLPNRRENLVARGLKQMTPTTRRGVEREANDQNRKRPVRYQY